MALATERAQPIDPELRTKAEQLLKVKTLALSFEENRGQWAPQVLYQAHSSQAAYRVMQDRISIGMVKQEDKITDSTLLTGLVWEYRFLEMNPDVVIRPHERLLQAGNTHYYQGNQRLEDVGRYREVRYEGIYRGIDLRLYSDGEGGLEYDYIVYPGAEVRDIGIALEGVEGISEGEDGLVVHTALGRIDLPNPYAYQVIEGVERQVKVSFRVQGNTLSFNLERNSGYDPDEVLIIDPVLLGFSTFLGGTRHEEAHEGTMLSDGSIIIAGTTQSVNYPVTAGAFQSTYGGYYDIFLIRYSSSGSVVFSTYFGGTGYDMVHDLIIRDDGNIGIAGIAGSNDFPVSPGMNYGGSGYVRYFVA
ncbi:MAG TPA: hypothetical protein P5550_12705, partial [Bacteroidales bacterium]|nr:hypothetical protein [Bacteroidales bacterium]